MSSSSFGRRVVRKSRAVKSRWASRYSVSLGTADPDLIFIAGTGRSGTTWLAELLARNSRRRLVFEPFVAREVPAWRSSCERLYLRPDDPAPQLRSGASRILTGTARSAWSDGHNSTLFTKGRIVKDIRANLILPWISNWFGPLPIIFIIRHPCAVATSWVREGWRADPAATFLTQASLLEDHLLPFRRAIQAAEDEWTRCLCLWAVEQHVVLKYASSMGLHLVRYEDLVLKPERTLSRIGDLTGIRVRRDASIEQPSSTTSPANWWESQSRRVSAWREKVSRRDVRAAERFMNLFGLDWLYPEDCESSADGLPGRAPGIGIL